MGTSLLINEEPGFKHEYGSKVIAFSNSVLLSSRSIQAYRRREHTDIPTMLKSTKLTKSPFEEKRIIIFKVCFMKHKNSREIIQRAHKCLD